MEAIARQPEASGDIRMNMIIAAALIEGNSFFLVLLFFFLTVCRKHLKSSFEKCDLTVKHS